MAQSQLTEQQLLSALVESPALWLETLTELNGAPTVLEPYQVRYLNDRSLFRVVNKARQIGLSTAIASEAVHSVCTRYGYNVNVVSINQREASDKIDIARNLYHSLSDDLGPLGLKPVVWNDSENEFSVHKPPKVSTFLSQPASAAIRGGRKDVLFDEFAHIRDSVKLYRAALPAITRGDSRLTIVSTPLGQSGLFYDICTDVAGYPEYSRHSIPWWESRAMVREGAYEEALAIAPTLDTDDRVARFGSAKLKSIRSGFGPDLIGFITEYEATFVDEAEAYFPWETIVDCVEEDQPIWTVWPNHFKPVGLITIGVDLAKERDETVFTVVEHVERDGEVHRHVRYIYHTRSSYEEQFKTLNSLIKASSASRVTIDQTGVGQVFVERAKSELTHTNVEGVVFTGQRKEQWATQLKGDMQRGILHWPRHQELLRQIHGIRRTKNEAGYYKFSGPKDDFFWSLILACYGEGRVPARISRL